MAEPQKQEPKKPIKVKKDDSIKVKKKFWYKIVAKDLFSSAVLGETTVSEINQVMGKPITVNLMTITNDMKKQHINISYKVVEIKDNTAYAKIIGYNVSPSTLKRFIKRGRTRIDDSFVVETKDNIKIRVKPLMVSITKISRSVGSLLRKHSRKYMIDNVKTMDFVPFMNAVIDNSVQNSTRGYLKKLTPLKTFEFKSIVFEKEKAGHKKEEIKVEEPKKEEVKLEEPKKEEIVQNA